MSATRHRSWLLIAIGLAVVAGYSSHTMAQPHPERPPQSATTASHRRVSYRLYTHCGIRWALIDGAWWQADRPLSDGSGNPPTGWGNPFQQGAITFLDGSTVSFASSAGSVTFRRTNRTDPPFICS